MTVNNADGILLIKLFGTLGIKLSSIQTTVDGGSSDAHHRGNLVHRHRLGFVQTPHLFDLLLVKFGGSSALPPAGTSGLESAGACILGLNHVRTARDCRRC